MDGGAGLLAALGCELLTGAGDVARPVPANLDAVRQVRGRPAGCRRLRFTIACDVDNPLCGNSGAARVFGPQKGASPEDVSRLDAALGNFASVLERRSGKSLRDIPGVGAAGGLALPLLAFCNARIVSGVDLMLDVADFDRKVTNANLVVTGEGRIDEQTLAGKVPVGVARRTAKFGKPVIALCGCVGWGYQKVLQAGVSAVFSTSEPRQKFTQTRRHAAENLKRLADGLFLLQSIGAGVAQRV